MKTIRSSYRWISRPIQHKTPLQHTRQTMSDISKDGSIEKKRRKPHTRASKACTFCRQQKTRCLRSDSSISCLRCLSLNLKCSLVDESDLAKEMPKVLSPPASAYIQPPPNSQQMSLLSQVKSVSSYLPTKSISPQLQPQQQQAQPAYDYSPQMLPSINSPITNMLYDRTQTPSGQVTRYPKTHESIPQMISPHLVNVMSPRLSQSFISASPLPAFTPDLEMDNKLDAIYSDVKQILDSLGTNANNSTASINSKNSNFEVNCMPIMTEPFNTTNIAIQHHLFSPINYLKLVTEQENINAHATSNGNSNAPNNIHDMSNSNNPNDQNTPVSLPLSIQQQLYPLHTFRLNYQDIISSNILTADQAIQLLDIFRDRYGRWVSFPAMTSTKKLLKRIRKRCPLLLTVSCLLSLKYGDPLLKQKIWNKLCSIVRKEVHWLSSTYSGGLEELQCLVILSAYCIGLSDSSFQDKNNNSYVNEPLLLLDGWHLSGIGLTLFDKINGYGLLDQMYGGEIELLWESNKMKIENKLGKIPSLHNGSNGLDNDDDEYDDDDEFNILTLHRIWNTLVLIQMAYCLIDGRKSWVGLDRLKPRDVSHLPNATNFDFRIVAEIHMYLIGYKNIMLNENYEQTIKSMKIWLEKWNSTFSQPSNQFVEIDYHFVEILIRIKQLKLDISSLAFLTTENLKDVLDIKMHAIAIINLINTVNDDSYFAFLSDQIHLTVFYATNILICIISAVNKYNATNNNNPQEMDSTHDKEILQKIEKLIFRYRTVSATTLDTFYKYYNILQNVYNSRLN